MGVLEQASVAVEGERRRSRTGRSLSGPTPLKRTTAFPAPILISAGATRRRREIALHQTYSDQAKDHLDAKMQEVVRFLLKPS